MSHITTARLESKHLDHSARLLAQRQQRLRLLNPVLPLQYEDAAACRSLLEDDLQGVGTEAVVALVDGEVVGFLIMAPLVFNPTDMVAAFMPPRPAQVHGAHAARPDVAYDAYREMYAVLADHFVTRGYFDHMVYVQAQDTIAHDAFVSLSFGRALVAAIRGLEPMDAGEAAVDIHEAGIEDLKVVMGLNHDLLLHHARAPIFWPHAPETFAALETNQRRHLEDPGTAHIVAYQNGRAVGMNSFIPPDWIDRVLRPDKTVYLYQGIVWPEARSGGIGKAILSRGVEWAREKGYEHIALHYAAPNISGGRFWQSQGFEPIEYRLTRHIDDRVAWAH